jgi:glycosyltransferase involved in cell wall biosynthesis
VKILIIAHYFPPENNMAMIATLRPLSWAKYWSRAGHEICILTTSKKENQNLQSQLSSNILGNVRIEGINYLLSRPNIKSEPRINLDKQNKYPGIYTFLRKILINTRQLIGAGSLFYGSDLWIVPAIKEGLAIYKEWKFDIIVSTFGPPASHIVASRLKQRLNVFWVADYRDLWNDRSFLSARFPFSFIEKKLEHTTVKNADILTTVSRPLAKKLKKKFRKPVIVIANGFEYPDAIKVISQTTKTPKIQLAYTGNIYLKKQDLRLLFQAIELLIKAGISIQDKLEILFYGWDTANLNELIKQYCLEGIVSVKGFVAREMAISVQRNVDALVFLDWNDKNEDGVLTGKIFEYMFSGTPILGIGASLETVAGRLIKESGTGILLGTSVEVIAHAIKDLLDGKKLEYLPNQEVLSQYTREALASKMLREVLKAYTSHCNKII